MVTGSYSLLALARSRWMFSVGVVYQFMFLDEDFLGFSSG